MNETIKPDKCCAMGTHNCAVPMPIGGRSQGVDYCIADLVAALNAAGIETIASCCGHKKQAGRIALADGRDLFVGPSGLDALLRSLAMTHMSRPGRDDSAAEVDKCWYDAVMEGVAGLGT